ncbi:class I SAM-dependent RNA methyltransferase [Oscillospiraceae bacterium OttesenSCG-928-G22]|nr:class I SAM-dependent RNA methyltransferase [Oscillospiraceae bacterium OttesenSCG-928-G22]
MDNFTYCAPCLFGLEGLVADELKRLRMADVKAEDGRVYFSGDAAALSQASVWLRCAERVLLVLGSFEARTFDELFEGVKALPLEQFLPKDAQFPVKGHCLNSALMSVTDCQKIIKKAAAVRLGQAYSISRMPESGALYQLQFFLRKDRVTLYLDTTGRGLYKRGYRAESGEAPIRETLAAGLVLLSRYRGREPFFDPFCGSGTIPIEAALIAKNRASGLMRDFAFSSWPGFREHLPAAKEEAKTREFSGDYQITGSDIDEAAVRLARDNAKKAGVSECIRFDVADARAFSGEAGGKVVANPPYGLRMLEQEDAAALIAAFGEATRDGTLDLYLLSADPEFERHFGRKAVKRRKLYNGMIRCELYQYYR